MLIAASRKWTPNLRLDSERIFGMQQILDQIERQQLVRPIVASAPLQRDLLRFATLSHLNTFLSSCIGPMVSIICFLYLDFWFKLRPESMSLESTWILPQCSHVELVRICTNSSIKLEAQQGNVKALTTCLSNTLMLNRLYQWRFPASLPESAPAAGLLEGLLEALHELGHHLASEWDYFVEFAIICTTNAIALSLWVQTFMLNLVYNINWRWQIANQLHNCTSAVVESRQHLGAHNARERWRRTTSLLTISYINYELLRRQQGAHRKLTGFLINQVAVLASVVFAISYLVACQLKFDRPSYQTAILTMFILILANIYLLLASVSAKLYERLMGELSKLVANLTSDQQLADSLMLELWRRQLLDDDEMSKLTSNELLGAKISYENLIALNAYMLAFWFITMRILQFYQ